VIGAVLRESAAVVPAPRNSRAGTVAAATAARSGKVTNFFSLVLMTCSLVEVAATDGQLYLVDRSVDPGRGNQ
jgi:hypothetical protein